MRSGRRDEDVAAAFAAAQENPDDPALARRAHAMRLALQREMGIEQPRLLSEAERDEIAGQLAQATPADRPAIIADLRARYGAHAGMLAAELAGEVDANTTLLLDHADIPHLPSLLANGMEKSAKDGPATLTLPRLEYADLLPALPIINKGEHAGRKLDMSSLKNGGYYRLPNGDVLLYDGEALVPVETAAPSLADPNASTPPLPLGKASPPRETAVKGIAYELDEQGNPLAVDDDGEIVDDLEAELPTPPTGLEDDDASLQADANEKAEDESGSVSAGPSPAEAQRNKTEAMTDWVKLAIFGKNVPGGWKEMPTLPNGMIDRRALERGQVYHVIGADGTRSGWRWNEGKRAFMPFRGKTVAFSIDGMHELIGVPIRRTPDGRSMYNMEQDRINAINWGVDAVFEIVDNPDADDNYRFLDRATRSYAKATVLENMETIERLAIEFNVDPQLVKAIMFREQAAGPVQPTADSLGISDTLSPMGFNPEIWHGLGIDRESASNGEGNIRAAVILISRIQDRITDPTPEKIATLYNGLMMENTSDYGALVGRYYKESPWLREDDDPQP